MSELDIELRQALQRYYETERSSSTHVQMLSDQAEQSGDYSDYDEASYDHWECMAEAGAEVVALVSRLLPPNTEV